MNVEVAPGPLSRVAQEPAELPPGGAGSICRAPHRWLRQGRWVVRRAGGSRAVRRTARPGRIGQYFGWLRSNALNLRLHGPRTSPPRARADAGTDRTTSRTFSMNSEARADSLKVSQRCPASSAPNCTPDAAHASPQLSPRQRLRASSMRAPMRSTCASDRFQRLHHHPLHVVVPYRAQRSRARLVQSSHRSRCAETAAATGPRSRGSCQVAARTTSMSLLPAVLCTIRIRSTTCARAAVCPSHPAEFATSERSDRSKTICRRRSPFAIVLRRLVREKAMGLASARHHRAVQALR